MEAEAAWKRARQEEEEDEDDEDRDVNVIDDGETNNRPQKTVKIRVSGTTGHVLDDEGEVVHVIEDFADPEDDGEEECEFCQKYTIYTSGPSIFVNMYRVRHGGSCEEEKISEKRLEKYRVSGYLSRGFLTLSSLSLGIRCCHGEEL